MDRCNPPLYRRQSLTGCLYWWLQFVENIRKSLLSRDCDSSVCEKVLILVGFHWSFYFSQCIKYLYSDKIKMNFNFFSTLKNAGQECNCYWGVTLNPGLWLVLLCLTEISSSVSTTQACVEVSWSFPSKPDVALGIFIYKLIKTQFSLRPTKKEKKHQRTRLHQKVDIYYSWSSGKSWVM